MLPMGKSRFLDLCFLADVQYGGDMIGVSPVRSQSLADPQPIRFQHIGLTVKTSLQSLVKLTTLRDLREAIQALDIEIEAMRRTIALATAPAADTAVEHLPTPVKKSGLNYDDIVDTVKLERLLLAREKTRTVLEDKVSWASAEQAKREAGES